MNNKSVVVSKPEWSSVLNIEDLKKFIYELSRKNDSFEIEGYNGIFNGSALETSVNNFISRQNDRFGHTKFNIGLMSKEKFEEIKTTEKIGFSADEKNWVVSHPIITMLEVTKNIKCLNMNFVQFIIN